MKRWFRSRDLNQKVSDEHVEGSGRLLGRDKELFDMPLEDRLEQETEAKQACLESVRTAREVAKAWDETAFTTERDVLRRWLDGQI
jgi:hypothetical protein